MGPLVTLLVGHRGAGKTSYLKSVAKFAEVHRLQVDAIDLDEEIARQSGVDQVGEVFSRLGEAEFRELEVKTFENLNLKTDRSTLIALGAGFSGPLPQGMPVVWIRRLTDPLGRSFLNRPRLNSLVSPVEEYLERFAAREDGYRRQSTDQLILPEGYVSGLEEFVLTPSTWKLPFELTLSAKHVQNWNDFWAKRLFWQLRHLEVRDDLLSAADQAKVLETLPSEKTIYSRRVTKGQSPKGIMVDWPLELGPASMTPQIFSLHEKTQSLKQALDKLRGPAVLKAALSVDDFEELREGHEWWLEAPRQRAFLPRSVNGRWRWYRSLFGRRMPIHYFREDEGSAADQPLLWQEVLQPDLQDEKGFAAVLGSPVEHSRSPLEHLEFFKKLDMPFVAVDVAESEFAQAIQVLAGMGMRFAAVTAPLKKLAFAVATDSTPEAELTQAANTLSFSGTSVKAHNTDVLALMKIKQNLPQGLDKVWLWGGGGVKTSVKVVWPEAVEVAARVGDRAADFAGGAPDLVIWATGRVRDFRWPSASVKPRLILDLNYSEDSPGLEWAVRENLNYKSGIEMFHLQAQAQREFWRRDGMK